jgi:uncharacterized protein (TIGR02449 family)
MTSERLNELESQIQMLIDHCHKLKEQNAELKKRVDELDQQRAKLESQNQAAAQRVRDIIAQLKD